MDFCESGKAPRHRPPTQLLTGRRIDGDEITQGADGSAPYPDAERDTGPDGSLQRRVVLSQDNGRGYERPSQVEYLESTSRRTLHGWSPEF